MVESFGIALFIYFCFVLDLLNICALGMGGYCRVNLGVTRFPL